MLALALLFTRVSSYAPDLTTEVVLKSGTGTGYGLGLFLSADSNGHRRWGHSGGAAGFFSYNVTLPDDHMAVTVLTNGQGRAASLLGS